MKTSITLTVQGKGTRNKLLRSAAVVCVLIWMTLMSSCYVLVRTPADHDGHGHQEHQEHHD